MGGTGGGAVVGGGRPGLGNESVIPLDDEGDVTSLISGATSDDFPVFFSLGIFTSVEYCLSVTPSIPSGTS